MKIERRAPRPILCKLPHTPNRFWIRNAVKYAILTGIGFLLFRTGQAHALIERGYEALGGEIFALFLPVLYWIVSRTVRDILSTRREKGAWW